MLLNNYFFHNDVDGCISCAGYCHAVKAFTNDEEDYVLHPVGSGMRGRFERMLNGVDNIYVFDYQYDARARLWIDHHQSESVGYEPILNQAIAYDHRSASAVALVDSYIRRFHGQQIPADVVTACNMIDSADYPSPEYIFTDTSPMMILRAFLEFSYPYEMMFCRVVEVLSATAINIERTNRILNIDKSYVTRLRERALNVKNHIEIYGKMSVIRQRYPLQNPRYAENFAVSTKYNIRISDESKTEKRISISYNKWHKEPNTINIGQYLKRAKHVRVGGGHFNVGGGIIDINNVESVLDNFSLTIGE